MGNIDKVVWSDSILHVYTDEEWIPDEPADYSAFVTARGMTDGFEIKPRGPFILVSSIVLLDSPRGIDGSPDERHRCGEVTFKAAGGVLKVASPEDFLESPDLPHLPSGYYRALVSMETFDEPRDMDSGGVAVDVESSLSIEMWPFPIAM